MNRAMRRKAEREMHKDIFETVQSMAADFLAQEEGVDLDDVTAYDFAIFESDPPRVHDDPLLTLRYQTCRDRFEQYMEAVAIAIDAGYVNRMKEAGLLIQDRLAFKRMLDRLGREQHEERLARRKGGVDGLVN